MSRWSDQFDNHPIHATIHALQEALMVEVEEIDAEHEAERRRFSKGLATITTALDGLDSEFYPESQLTNLNKQLRQPQIWNELTSYSSSTNVQHLRNANDHLTGQIPVIHQIAALAGPPKATEKIKSIEKAYDDFCEAIEKAAQDFETRLAKGEEDCLDLQNRLDVQSKALADLKTQSETAFSEWQVEFGEDQNSRAEEFSAAQIQRGEKFDGTLREIRTKSESETKEISAKHNDRLKAAFESYSQEVQVQLDDVKAKHAAILEIHGLVGTDGVAGGYQKTATDEHNAANTWRIVAMVSLGLAAAWLLLKFFLGFGEAPTGSLKWAELVTAGSLTLVFLAAAGYASRQSKSHRDLEQQMRWFSLEVKAIDPFLSSLEDVDQKELKKQLSERLFGKDRTTNQAKKGGVDVGTYKELSESILSPVQEIIRLVGKGQ